MKDQALETFLKLSKQMKNIIEDHTEKTEWQIATLAKLIAVEEFMIHSIDAGKTPAENSMNKSTGATAIGICPPSTYV